MLNSNLVDSLLSFFPHHATNLKASISKFNQNIAALLDQNLPPVPSSLEEDRSKPAESTPEISANEVLKED
jgi:hypothetical protein